MQTIRRMSINYSSNKLSLFADIYVVPIIHYAKVDILSNKTHRNVDLSLKCMFVYILMYIQTHTDKKMDLFEEIRKREQEKQQKQKKRVENLHEKLLQADRKFLHEDLEENQEEYVKKFFFKY